MKLKMKLIISLIIIFIELVEIECKGNLTIDNFFNYTSIRSISLSSNGEFLLIHTKSPLWNENIFQHKLILYRTKDDQQKLITDQLFEGTKLQWSPSQNYVVFLTINQSSKSRNDQYRFHPYLSKFNQIPDSKLYFYSMKSDQIKSISIENDFPLSITWSKNDSLLYYVTIDTNSTLNYLIDFKCLIYELEIDIEKELILSKKVLKEIPFLISEIVYNNEFEQILMSSITTTFEYPNLLQIYSIDLNNISSINQLTFDSSIKLNLQFSFDKKRLFYQTYPTGSLHSNSTQQRLYSIQLFNGQIQRWGNDFNGNILTYTIKYPQGISYLGQLGVYVQIYSQISSMNESIKHDGFNGSYQLITSSESSSAIAFVYTSFTNPQETYFIQNINQLKTPQIITNFNIQYEQMNLPQCDVYQWNNVDDNETIEGILTYPPGRFHETNLPLLVLIHGGPTDASMNYFLGNWLTWAPLAAAHGWLVFEPNYRGSTGYGDDFLNEIRLKPLSRPGKDILDGVDSLIKDQIVDQTKLTIGGYSYGGFLTNWIITQTNRFNAAVSGAGAIEQVSMWGNTDFPLISDFLFGAYPWIKPNLYQSESPIYYFDRIRTPTNLVSGDHDVRVPFQQNLMFYRALKYLNVPTNLLLLPNEGHPLGNNPSNGKLKVQQELYWLQLYGFNSTFIN